MDALGSSLIAFVCLCLQVVVTCKIYISIPWAGEGRRVYRAGAMPPRRTGVYRPYAMRMIFSVLNTYILHRARSYLKAVSEAQWELQHSSASRRPGLSSQPSQVSPTRRMAHELTLFLKGSSCCSVVHSAPRRGTPVAVRGPTSCSSICRSMRRTGSTGLAPPPPGHEPPPKSRYAHSQALVFI
jgi:hypothetical protein